MKTLFFFMLIAIIYGCSKSESSQNSSTCDSSISYSKKVKPILVANCTISGCHDGNSYPSLADYNVAYNGVAQIRTSVANGAMPRGFTLNSADKSAIICWIDNGAKNN